MANISIDYKQSIQARFYESLRAMGIQNPLISLTIIRLIAQLTTTKNTYELKLKENTGSDLPNEHKLAPSEYFLPIDMALGVQKYDTDSAGNLQGGNFPIFSYAEPNYFVGASGGKKESDALALIWNGGLMSIKTGGTELHKDIMTNLFGYRPDGQYLEAAASGNTNDMLPEYGPSISEKGFGPLYNEHILKGDQENSIIIHLASGDNSLIDGPVNAAGAAVTTRNRMVVDLLGFVCHGDLPGPDSSGKFCQI